MRFRIFNFALLILILPGILYLVLLNVPSIAPPVELTTSALDLAQYDYHPDLFFNLPLYNHLANPLECKLQQSDCKCDNQIEFKKVLEPKSEGVLQVP